MRWKGARCSRQYVMIDSAVSRVGSCPATSTTYALGTASRTGSGAGTTAASATAGCSISTDSNSKGLIL